MKRQAEKQLIRDEADADDGGNDGEPGTGFKMAPKASLAAREIRGLPKRRVAGGTGPPMPSSTTEEAAPSPKFAGFSGFGTTPSSKPFTFNSTSTTAPTAPAPTGSLFSSPFSGFGAPPAAAPAPMSASSASGPTSAAKTFNSFLSGSTNGPSTPTTNGSKDTKPAPSFSGAPKAEPEDDKAAVDFYCALRGLNISFLDSVKKAVEADAFADISSLFENYKKYRQDSQNAFDKKSASQATPVPSKAPEIPKPAEAPKPTMPAAPASFSGFGSFGSTPASSTSTPSAPPPKLPGMPTPPTTFSGFGSFGKAPETSPPAKAAPAPTTSFGSFGKPAEPSSEAAKPAPLSGGFSFGGSDSSKPTSSASSSSSFTFGAPPSSGNSMFGSGTSSAPSSLPFSFSKPASSNSSTAPISSLPFSFGGSSSSSTASSPPSEAPKSVFGGFGKPEDKKEDKPSAASSGFGFGAFGTKPSGSSGTGFSFGTTSTSTSSFSETKPASSAPKPGFSFGAPSTGFSFGSGGSSSSFGAPAKKEEEDNKDSDAGSTVDGATPAPDGMSPFGSNPHDEEGEGEEDETTTHSIKSKVYRMKKADEKGGVGWVEIGSGILRLKKHKESDARRVLLRNSTTGKVNVNFKIYSALKPSLAKKTVTFIGHDNGVAQTYSVRVGSEAAASELKEAMDREIEFVKSKESV